MNDSQFKTLLKVLKNNQAETREMFKQQALRTDNLFRQIEALLSLFSTLEPGFPLSDTRGWAASPDFLKKVCQVILGGEPGMVLEASSGISTVISAYCLKRIGAGSIVSLEHDAKFAEATRNQLTLHGLGDIATIVHAPLRQYNINGQPWLWYDIDSLEPDRKADVFLIDGPPEDVQKMARYPALPLTSHLLNENATILLDDGARPDEQAIAQRWSNEFTILSAEYLPFEKGAFIFHKQ